MVSPQSHRAGLGLSILAALILAACSGGPRVSSPMTTTSTQGNPVDTVTAYPPLPRPPAGSPQGCLGLKGAGLTATVANQVRQGVLAISGTAELLMLSTCPGGPVLVGLQPGQEVLAHRLWSRYGGDVSISVGLTSYDGTPGRSPRCGVVHQPSPLPMGLRVTLDLSSQYVRSGSSFDAKVVVTNDESINFSMDTGQPLQAVIVRPGTRQVVGIYNGGIGGTGFGRRLSPGQSEAIPVIGGTARCDGGIGSALPPGRYQVIVRVAPETQPQTPTFLTPPVTIHVT